MQAIEPLEYGFTYHIYNRGINGADLFTCRKNHEHFLELYDKYVSPIADTYTWVLLQNHFHILVRIKEEKEILPLSVLNICPTLSGDKHTDRSVESPDSIEALSVSSQGTKWDTRKPVPSKQFSHLFNAYAKYFNLCNHRHGALFEAPFRRIRVDTGKYFCQLVYYIHSNPVNHSFVKCIQDWRWSSYLTIVSTKPTRLLRETVIEYFDDLDNFKAYHGYEHDFKALEKLWLE